MLKLNKKKGFSIIEQLCALSIFSILTICVISLQLNNLRLRDYNRQILLYSSVLEALKQEILYNYSYCNVKDVYFLNKRYISQDKLTISSVRTSDLNQLFSESEGIANTYLILSIVDGEVLKIHMELHVKFKYKEEIIVCEFNKGNYI